MGTVIAGAVVLGIILLAIRSVYRDHKRGGCASCSGECGGCAHHADQADGCTCQK